MQNGEIFDYDLNFLTPLLALFDDQLRKLSSEAREIDDPDQFGYLDRLDYLSGIGFSAIQQYLTATYTAVGISRSEALSIPPLHNESGQSVVSIINAGANFWKHHEEWPYESEKRRKNTVDVIIKSGVKLEGAYVCSDLIETICGTSETPFALLKEVLIKWRDNLIKK